MTSRLPERATALASLLGIAACALYSNDDGGHSDHSTVLAADIFAEPIEEVDLLFVIDNSGSMEAEQDSLAHWAEDSLFGLLRSDVGAQFDLHIAVVSSDMGAGPYNIANCTGKGDDGAFQSAPRAAGCSAPDGAFLVDVEDGEGGRAGNYAGSLAEAFGCIARLGIDGCGFEQPLEAMRRALDGSNPENAGFLREDALLAVLFVTDEDDCSAFNTRVFDTSQNDLDDPLGPLSSYRCFEFGVECDQEDLRSPGEKTGCESAGSQYLEAPEEYVEFLRGLKPDPSMVFVGGLFGQPDSVFVDYRDDAFELRSTCAGAGASEATPAVRLKSVVDAFPCRNGSASICDGDLRWPLAEVARRITDVANRSPCLIGDLEDVAAVEGVQPDCRVLEVAGEHRAELPACEPGGPRPCYRIEPEPESCARTDTQLALAVERPDPPRSGTRYVALCDAAGE